MTPSPHQAQIIQFIDQSPHQAVTFRHIVDQFGHWYYTNADHHIGMTLARMVKNNQLIRAKKGIYMIGSGKKEQPVEVDPNQLELF